MSALSERVAQLKDDIRSGEVGPNILCRQVDKLAVTELYEALREIATRLDSAAAEVDCFNVYESRDLARDALAKADAAEMESLGGAELGLHMATRNI